MASAECMNSFDLCQRISAYVDGSDLLALDCANKLWHQVILYQFQVLRDSEKFKYLAYKQNSSFHSNKRICHRIHRNRAAPVERNTHTNSAGTTSATRSSYQGPRGLFVFGGSFGSVHSDSFLFHDNNRGIKGRRVRSANIYPGLGSVAGAIDRDGRVLIAGGWDDIEEVALSCVYALDMKQINSRQNCWQPLNPINSPRCYGALASTINGDLLFAGGGNSPYRGARVYGSCLLKTSNAANSSANSNSDNSSWIEHFVPSMISVRCGHSAVTLYDDNILVTGGYAGRQDYLETVELFERNLERWVALPSMHHRRSGMATVLGPYGSVYVTGGSPDGILGHKSLERFDPREGKWFIMPPMNYERGYTAGCVGSHECFYVSGGIANHRFQGSIECFDFKANRWSVLAADTTPDPQNQANAVHQTGNVNNNVPVDVADIVVDEEEAQEDWETVHEDDIISEDILSDNFYDEYLLRACHQMMYIL